MNLKSLLLCSDDKIVRVLRRTLGDLDIRVELCASSEIALRKLTRERFEAIIVDCAGPGARRCCAVRGCAVQQAGYRGGDSGSGGWAAVGV